MFVVKYKKLFLTLFLLFVLFSIFTIYKNGLRLGIDFTGGSIIEVEYEGERPSVVLVKEKIKELALGDSVIQETGEKGIMIKTRDLTEEERVSMVTILKDKMGTTTLSMQEKRFDSIGPVIGEELKDKAIIAILLVCLMIALFIAFAFRQVSYPIKSYKYGISAIIALGHDTIISTGVIAYMGVKYGTEVDLLFISALLAILGFSVHDTIVVFDRIRENLKNKISKSFEETIGISIEQTYVRSINTSATTMFTLLALYFLGGETTKTFALILSVGVFVGTYSSIFLAPLLLLFMEKTQKRVK